MKYDFVEVMAPASNPAAIVSGAGGVVSDWNGRPLKLDMTVEVIACGDPHIHDRALKILKGSGSG